MYMSLQTWQIWKLRENILVVKKKKGNYVDWNIEDKEEMLYYRCITPIQKPTMSMIIS